jgi:SulP family sulfate permease
MSEVRHFGHILRVAPRNDVMVLLTCFGLTVAFDMVIAVGIGIVLAALLFMQRMSSLFQAQLAEGPSPHFADPGLAGVVVYRIAGPLFFGAAEKAASTLGRISDQTRAVVMQMDDVPVMDVTGLVALESAIGRLRRMKVFVALVGVQAEPRQMLEKSGIASADDGVAIFESHDAALAAIRALLNAPH